MVHGGGDDGEVHEITDEEIVRPDVRDHEGGESVLTGLTTASAMRLDCFPDRRQAGSAENSSWTRPHGAQVNISWRGFYFLLGNFLGEALGGFIVALRREFLGEFHHEFLENLLNFA